MTILGRAIQRVFRQKANDTSPNVWRTKIQKVIELLRKKNAPPYLRQDIADISPYHGAARVLGRPRCDEPGGTCQIASLGDQLERSVLRLLPKSENPHQTRLLDGAVGGA